MMQVCVEVGGELEMLAVPSVCNHVPGSWPCLHAKVVHERRFVCWDASDSVKEAIKRSWSGPLQQQHAHVLLASFHDSHLCCKRLDLSLEKILMSGGLTTGFYLEMTTPLFFDEVHIAWLGRWYLGTFALFFVKTHEGWTVVVGRYNPHRHQHSFTVALLDV